jgi:acyl-CoA reductase-like NAD-dependent aldehyde dehydrogenase
MTTETGIRTYGLLIDGQFVPAASGETFPTYNPATNEVIGYVARASREDVDRAVRAARRAFDEGPWGRMTPNERARRLRRVAGDPP